jgi:hypothetical protein
MQRTKRVRVVFLALSGVCAVLCMAWFSIPCCRYAVDALDAIWPYNYDVNGRAYEVIEFIIFALFIPLAALAVFFFVKGFVPAKRMVLKIIVLTCILLLGGYIATVAFIKVDFVSVWPIRIVCGITPVLAAFGAMLLYGGKKWCKALCAVLASLALYVSTWTLTIGNMYNTRTIIGYSQSPEETHQIIVFVCPGNISLFGRDNWTSYVACPVYGLWYKQDNPEYVDPDVLERVTWIDEHTAQFNDRHGFPRTITFK